MRLKNVHKFFAAVAALLLPFLFASLILIGGDLASLWPETGRYLHDTSEYVWGLTFLFALYLWSAVWLIFAAAGVLLLAGRDDPLQNIVVLRRGLLNLALKNDAEPMRGARFLSFLLMTLVFLLGTDRLVFYFVENFNTVQLVALASSVSIFIWALLTLGLAWLATRIFFGLARWRWLRPLIHTRSSLALLVAGAVSLAIIAIIFERDIFKELDGWALYLPVFALFAALSGLMVFPPRWSEKLRLRLNVFLLLASFLTLVLLVLGLGLAPGHSNVRALLLSHGRNASQLLGLWSAATDFDGDGVSSLLGGGDCAPFDSFVHPGALDIPDNGVDEDCFDGDLKKPELRIHGPKFSHPKLAVAKPDVIIFSIDTCRRDILGVYGNTKEVSPNIDAFAREAIIFDDAIPEASWTMPSFAAALSGRYASELDKFYGAVRAQKVPRNVPLIQERFHAAGYKTVAVTAGLQLDKLGIERGFDDWQCLTRTPRGNFGQKVVDAGARVLMEQSLDEPLLLWVHAIDLHYPYRAPKKHEKFGKKPFGKYLAELNFVDKAFADLRQAIHDSGRDERSIVVIFSDHGEAFGEHGYKFHGHTTYAEELRIPLIIKMPKNKPRRIQGLAGLIDLAPTLYDLVGLNTDKHLRGMSLAPYLTDVKNNRIGDRAIFSEQTRYTRDFSLTTPTYQLRYDQSHNYVELFDRVKDPREQKNLANSKPQVVLDLRRQLNNKMASISYQVGAKLQHVLLREIPPHYQLVQGAFANGLNWRALALDSKKSKQIQISMVVSAEGPLKGGRFELKVSLFSAKDKRLGGAKTELGEGVYHPGRWRAGEIIQDQVNVRSTAALKDIERVCITVVVDKKPLKLADTSAEEGTSTTMCQRVQRDPQAPAAKEDSGSSQSARN